MKRQKACWKHGLFWDWCERLFAKRFFAENHLTQSLEISVNYLLKAKQATLSKKEKNF